MKQFCANPAKKLPIIWLDRSFIFLQLERKTKGSLKFHVTLD